MSLKDRLRFNGYVLPIAEAATFEYAIWGWDGIEDQFEVRGDGSLWRNTHNTFWNDAPNHGTPNWRREPLTGELIIDYAARDAEPLRWSLYFVDGALKQVHRIDGMRRRVDNNQE